MKTIDRRRLLRGVLFGSAAGLAFAPIAATAMPLGVSPLPGALDEWIEKAQAVVVRPAPRRRPRRQVWRCWWNRGRRVCGWRWV